MRRSDLFVPTSKEKRSGAEVRSAELALRSGLVHQLGSGIFAYSPTGKLVRNKISEVIREEMEAIGSQEVDLPGLQYAKIWRDSGRYEEFEGEMFTFKNRDDQAMCLAPTHEEAMADMVRERLRSQNNMPLVLYQIAKKFRDDHARNGLIRAKEFTMKDAYSFTVSEEDLDEIYEDMRKAYINIFDSLGLDFAITQADPGAMGGTGSEEFQAPAEIGSDEINRCPEDDCLFGTKDLEQTKCPEHGTKLENTNTIELGHIFKLGTRYSEPLDLTFDTQEGEEHIIMGSYGIGVSRVIPTLIEQRNDEGGIIWPESVAPYEMSIIPLDEEGEIMDTAEELYNLLDTDEVLLFDNGVSIGEKFAESDLIGIPAKVILGNNYLEDGEIEVEYRDGSREYYDRDGFVKEFA